MKLTIAMMLFLSVNENRCKTQPNPCRRSQLGWPATSTDSSSNMRIRHKQKPVTLEIKT